MAGEEPRGGSSKLSKWLVMELEVGLRIGSDLGTSRCIVCNLEMAGSGSSKLMASNATTDSAMREDRCSRCGLSLAIKGDGAALFE